jgi:hypothetical protein
MRTGIDALFKAISDDISDDNTMTERKKNREKEKKERSSAPESRPHAQELGKRKATIRQACTSFLDLRSKLRRREGDFASVRSPTHHQLA